MHEEESLLLLSLLLRGGAFWERCAIEKATDSADCDSKTARVGVRNERPTGYLNDLSSLATWNSQSQQAVRRQRTDTFEKLERLSVSHTLHGREKLVSALPVRKATARVPLDQRPSCVLATQTGEQTVGEDLFKVWAR